MKPKSINALMAYMRDKKNIHINGSGQKRKLRNMGYFHGYKGYRFCNTPNDLFNYTDFNEVQAVYSFDMKLKAAIYTRIMFVETSMKNYALEVLMSESKSKKFADIFSSVINDYKSYTVGTNNYTAAINKRLGLRNKIYSAISRDYGKNFIVSHYYDKDQSVPIWALFELITIGEFGTLLSCCNKTTRKKISKSIGLNASDDSDGRLSEQLIYLLRDLRNSVAHNNIIFDTRFKTNNVANRLKTYVSKETGIQGITFETIVDYVILISYLMRILGCSKIDIKSFIRQFEGICEELHTEVPSVIFMKIIHTDTRSKLNSLRTYLG
jgi:abortive infection bacteriophage resistance protein